MLLAGTRRKRAKQPGRPFGGRPWDEDEKVLRRVYVTGGLNAAMAALPHRSRTSILQRAHILGLTRVPRITREERETVRRMWWSASPSKIAATLGISMWRLERIARKERLTAVPPHRETLQAAADRVGYAVATLVRILRWAGVHIKRSCPSYPRKGVTCQWHYVDPEKVDDAVAAWIQSEASTVTEMDLAREYGVSGTLVRSEMAKAGVKRDERGRLPMDSARAVMAAWMATLPVSIAAVRLGVHVSTLAMALEDAGHTRPPPKHQWRVNVDEARDALAKCTRRRSRRPEDAGRENDAERSTNSHHPGSRPRAA